MKLSLLISSAALMAISINASSLAAPQYNAADVEYDKWIAIQKKAAKSKDWDTACTAIANTLELKDVVNWINPKAKTALVHNANIQLKRCRRDGDKSVATISADSYTTSDPTIKIAQGQTQPTAAENEELLENAKSIGIDMCAPSTLGGIGAPILIGVLGPQYGCNSGQIKAAQQWNAQMQQECKMQGFDKYDKKCMNF